MSVDISVCAILCTWANGSSSMNYDVVGTASMLDSGYIFGTLLLLCYMYILNYKKFCEELIAYFPLIRHGPHKKFASNNSSIIAYVFFAAVTFLSSRGYTYRPGDWWKGFMKSAVDVRSGSMIYIRSFTKYWFRSSKVDGGGGDTNSMVIS
jgi:hypothetical protein